MAAKLITQCATCGNSFSHYASKKRTYCSQRCIDKGAHSRGIEIKPRITGINLFACDNCGTEVREPRTLKRDGTLADRRFCSRACYDEQRATVRDGHISKCAGCRKDFKRPTAMPQKYCCVECKKSDKRAAPAHCISCGCWFTAMKWRKKGGGYATDKTRKTCSFECQFQWHRDNKERKLKIGKAFTAEKHPLWKGGVKLQDLSSRGPSWKSQREKALKRDGFACVDCGLSNDDCKSQYSRGLDVDHIIPFHNFGNSVKANVLSNLECRCASCHRIAEAKRTCVQMILPFGKIAQADRRKRRKLEREKQS